MTVKFYSTNLVDQSTLTPSTENALFPVENIQDTRRTKVYRSTSNSDELVFDFQETSEVDSIIMVDNHRSGFGVSAVTLEMHGTNTWGAPAFTQVLDLPSIPHGVGFTELAAIQSYQFARLVMTSTLAYCELSNLFLGKAIELLDERSINYGWSYQDKDLSTVKSNRYGQDFVDIITRQKQLNISFSNLSKEQMEQLYEIYDDKGITKPFFIRLGCDNMTTDYRRFSGMVKMSQIPMITNKSFGRYNLSMTLEESM